MSKLPKRIAIDFKQMAQPSSRLLRLMQTTGKFTACYRDRINLFGDRPSAIIFPEQILGLNQKAIYSVAFSSQKNEFTLRSFVVENPKLFNPAGDEITTVEEVLAVEDAGGEVRLNRGYDGRTFASNIAMFSSRRDAYRWAAKLIEKMAK